MNARLTLHVLGGLLLFLAGTLLLPVPYSLAIGDGALVPFVLASLTAAVIGAAVFWSTETDADVGLREGFAIVTFGWLVFSLFGALPYWFSGAIPSFLDAFFEAVAGFTTTGSTIVTDIDALPRSIVLWRSLTQWLGGMGIIVLSLAILPMLGVGGMQMFRAEVPGPTKDKLRPRVQDTARLLWEAYFALTLAEILLLGFGEMSWFEAINHGLTTMATGGFSTNDASIGGFTSSYTHVVITCFMFFAGMNFALHFYAFRGRLGTIWRSQEFRVYAGVVLAATAVVALLTRDHAPHMGIALRDAAFTVVSMATSTGYGTADYESWPVVVQAILVGLMIMGGMAGSTGGGMKVVRVMLLFKHAWAQLFRLIHPRGIRVIRIDNRAVADDVIQSVLGFGALYSAVGLTATVVLTGTGADLVTAVTGVISALSNIGPGLGTIGPTENFAHLSPVAKLTLSGCMLMGRLELFTVLVLFLPSFWRR